MKYSVSIIDDEILAVELLKDYCSKIDFLEISSCFTDPIKAYNFLSLNTVDLIFMDINMPELNGLDLAKVIPSKTHLIFATAYRQYGVEAFELQALDYLLKPISYPRFLKAIQRFQEILPKSSPEKESNFLIIRADRKDHKLLLEDILYIEGLKDYVKIFTNTGTLYTKASVGQFMKKLPSHLFTRIHKSYIISNQKLTAIGQEEVLLGKKSLPIGITFRSDVKKIFKNGL